MNIASLTADQAFDHAKSLLGQEYQDQETYALSRIQDADEELSHENLLGQLQSTISAIQSEKADIHTLYTDILFTSDPEKTTVLKEQVEMLQELVSRFHTLMDELPAASEA